MRINKVYNEDCLLTMFRMPSDFVDLVVTSPPYDNLRTYKGYSFDFEETAKSLFEIVKPGGVIVWVVNDATIKGDETGTSFKQALFFKEIGFRLYDTMIYQTDKPPMNARRYQACFEYMFVFSRGKPKTFNAVMVPCKKAGKTNRGSTYYDGQAYKRPTDKPRVYNSTKIKDNIWKFPSGGTKTGHPAVFPEQLAKDHILSWSNPGDLVYDPFMGSGTTAKMALLTGRNYIGSEMSAEYCDIIKDRVTKTLKEMF